MSSSGLPLMVALAMVEARSSVGLARRDAVSSVKYWNISSSAPMLSSMVPRCSSSSSLPNSSCVQRSMEAKSDSGTPSSVMIMYSG